MIFAELSLQLHATLVFPHLNLFDMNVLQYFMFTLMQVRVLYALKNADIVFLMHKRNDGPNSWYQYESEGVRGHIYVTLMRQ